eukprot:scaffold977_cov253-Pinguiococcus_pyrenoidosus.AAC.44
MEQETGIHVAEAAALVVPGVDVGTEHIQVGFIQSVAPWLSTCVAMLVPEAGARQAEQAILCLCHDTR